MYLLDNLINNLKQFNFEQSSGIIDQNKLTIYSKELIDYTEKLYSNNKYSGLQKKLFNKIIKEFNKIINTQNYTEETGKRIISYTVKLTESLKSGVKNMQEKKQETIKEQDKEILTAYIHETRENLEKIENKALQYEKENDPEFINSIFRLVHTIKGTASFLGLKEIKEVSHSFESLLHDLRTNEFGITADITDIILEGVDLLSRLVNNLEYPEKHEIININNFMNKLKSISDKALSESNALLCSTNNKKIDTIRNSINILNNKAALAENENAKDICTRMGTVLNSISTILENKDSGVKNNIQSMELISPEIIDKFAGEAADYLENIEKELLDFEKNPGKRLIVDEIFRQIHTIKGNAGFFKYFDIEDICTDIENILEELRSREKNPDHNTVTLLLSNIDAVNIKLKEKLNNEKSLPGKQIDIPEIIEPHKEKIRDENLPQSESKTIISAQNSINNNQFSKEIRVESKKLDILLDLIGELITSQAMVINNPDIQDIDKENFNKAAQKLNNITRDVQEITMSVRMVPLGRLFNKTKRLVRDLSRMFNKDIQILISGENTEMDRNVIEEISDPLIHIIRNIIDHGIESKETRKKLNKNEKGTIWLQAKCELNEIWITVEDDGQGLDKEKILKRAKEKGLIPEGHIELSDQEIWNFIFLPGFSTADTVTEISGRGVGMDVVKQTIEKLNGKINISSVPLKGTKIIIKIPLTLSIIDGIVVRVKEILYALPLSDILEFHKPVNNHISVTENGNKVLQLRDSIIPILVLGEIFKLNGTSTEINEGIMIICESGNTKAGLLVDEIIGYKQIVVKSIPDYIGNRENVSGCCILETGDVGFIIDTSTLIFNELGSGIINNPKKEEGMFDRDIDYENYLENEENNNNRYLLFNIGNEAYGINILFISRIIEFQKITQMPEMPNFVKGVINLRGKIIPIIDLVIRFGMERTDHAKRMCIVIVEINKIMLGFIVDSVEDIRQINEENIEKPPDFKTKSEKKNYISGLARIGDEVKIIIDIKKLIHEKDLETIKSMV